MITLIILCSLMFAALIIVAVFMILLYTRMTNLIMINGAYQSEQYRSAVAVQKSAKPTLSAVKQTTRGRRIEKNEELVDMADLPWEEGYKLLEEMGNGSS